VHAAVFGYFADKKNAPVAGLTADSIDAFLRDARVADETIASVRGVIDACDAARYAAPAGAGEGGHDIATRARSVITTLERGAR
jgi:hypothetical protein